VFRLYDFQGYSKGEKTGGTMRTFDVKKGSSSHCLEEPGVYQLVPMSCHKFDKLSYTFDT
jgi:hypothetical protein